MPKRAQAAKATAATANIVEPPPATETCAGHFYESPEPLRLQAYGQTVTLEYLPQEDVVLVTSVYADGTEERRVIPCEVLPYFVELLSDGERAGPSEARSEDEFHIGATGGLQWLS